MSGSNKGPNVDYRLQNLTNALYLTNTDDVALRTGITGDIIINGNVTIPETVQVYSNIGNAVHTHITEVGYANLVALGWSWVPVAGNVTLDPGSNLIGNVKVSQLPAITGNVNIDNFPGNVSITQLPAIGGNVHIYGNVDIDHLPNIGILGNINGITTLPAINGNVGLIGNLLAITTLPAITGNVGVSGNVSITQLPAIGGNVGLIGNLLAITTLPAITGNVGVSGNVSITQMPAITIASIPEVEIKNDSGNAIPISANTSANSPTNRIYVSMETDAVIADSNYELNVARGLVDHHYSVERSAYMPATPNSETSIWVEGGIYPHGTWTVADQIYVNSSAAGDTGQTILIEGLNSSYTYITETITTSGTGFVHTANSFIRIQTATITSASTNSSNAGEIRFRIGSSTGNVVAHIGVGLGVTKLSQYTVPANCTGYVLYGDVATFKNGAGNQSGLVKMMVRPYGGSFIAAFIAQVSNGYYRNDFRIPLPVPAKADIDVRILTDATGSTVSSNYQILIIPN